MSGVHRGLVVAAAVAVAVLAASCAAAPGADNRPAQQATPIVSPARDDLVRHVSVPADAPAPPSAGLLVAIAPPPPPPVAQAAPAPRAARDAPSAVSRKAPDRPAAPVASGSAYASQLTAGVNAERSRAGLASLGASSCAQRYAQRWAEHLASTGEFGHQSLGPVLSGCGASQAAENIARGSGSPSTLVAAWMASSGHRANILDAGLTVAGMAAVQGANGSWTAVQVFLTP